MYDHGPGAQQARIVMAQLTGAVRRHAGWKATLTEPELAEAVQELADLTAGRGDGPQLMAEVAGILAGTAFGVQLEDARAIVAAQILVAAGADELLIDGWTEIGQERAAQARGMPHGRLNAETPRGQSFGLTASRGSRSVVGSAGERPLDARAWRGRR